MIKNYLTQREELQIVLESFNKQCFAFDTETEEVEGEHRVTHISLCDGRTAIVIPINQESNIVPVIKDLFEGEKKGKGKIIIGHNIVYDAKVLRLLGINFYNAEWYDTMIAAHLLDEEGEKGLKALSRALGFDDIVEYEQAIVKGRNSQEFLDYALNDAIHTWALCENQRPQILQEGLMPLFCKIEMPFLRAIMEMEVNGILIDQTVVKETTKELKKALFDLETQMLDLLEEPYELQQQLFSTELVLKSNINFNSTQQLTNILVNRLGLEVDTKTKSGNLSVGKQAIMKLKGQHEFITLLEKYKIASKLLHAFFEPMPEHIKNDGRIHPRLNDAGTVTGRLSCSNPNLQQLPKVNSEFPVDTRKCFIAPKGKVLIAADYSQQELRIMTHLSQDPTLIKIMLEDGDIHLINANNVFNLGIPEEKLYAKHPEYDAIKKQYKKERDKGKIFSFGIAYGMGAHKLSRDFKVDMEEAERLLDNFFKGFPKLEEAIKETHQVATNKLFVVTLTGRKRRFKINQWGRLDDKNLRQSFNFLIQSFGADLIRRACVKMLNYGVLHPEYDTKLLMTIHDEILLECNEEYAETVRQDVERIMESCGNLIVPLKAEAKIGKSYSECK